jgi:hypothetical protein
VKVESRTVTRDGRQSGLTITHPAWTVLSTDSPHLILVEFNVGLRLSRPSGSTQREEGLVLCLVAGEEPECLTWKTKLSGLRSAHCWVVIGSGRA